jgi:hypothetical protein
MNQVKAKFRCNFVTDYGWAKEANLSAVYSSTGENADFNKATPFGELKIRIDKDVAAADFFQPNKEYYLYFEEVPVAKP